MKRLMCFVVALAVCGFWSGASAQDSGALINKLVEKGVLSDQEGEEVRAELLKEFSATPAGKFDVKDTVQKLTLFGDLRLRYEYVDGQNAFDDSEDAATEAAGFGSNFSQVDNRDDNSRVRYRLRFGLKALFADNLEFGLRLASGAVSDITSTNQTMGDWFGKDAITIDQAYLKWGAQSWLTLWGGKYDVSSAIYTTDMFWDSDVTAEGATEQFSFKPVKNLEVFANLVQWVYSDVSEVDADGGLSDVNDGENANEVGTNRVVVNDDGWLFGGQAGAQFDFTPKKTYAKAAAGYWYYANSGDVNAANNGVNNAMLNSTLSGFGNNIGTEFQIFDVLGEFVYTPGSGIFESIPFKVYGHFIMNLAPGPNIGVLDDDSPEDDDGATIVSNNPDDEFDGAEASSLDRDDFVDISNNKAWRMGLQLGSAKLRGQWEINGWYEEVGSDAVPDYFNDSDIANGLTNHKGYGIKAKYLFRDWWEFGIAYLDFEWLDPDINQDVNRGGNTQARTVQVDTVVKF